MSYFHVGHRHPANVCEQLAGLAGYSSGDKLYVEALIPVHLSKRSENQAEFTEKIHNETIEELKVMNGSMAQSDSEYIDGVQPWTLLGYIHSHPGELKTEMSIPDMELHERMSRDTCGCHVSDRKPLMAGSVGVYITVIVNPHTQEISAYWDSSYAPVDVVMLG